MINQRRIVKEFATRGLYGAFLLKLDQVDVTLLPLAW